MLVTHHLLSISFTHQRDGDTKGTLAHTDELEEPYLDVDLNGVVDIRCVRIWNRDDDYASTVPSSSFLLSAFSTSPLPLSLLFCIVLFIVLAGRILPFKILLGRTAFKPKSKTKDAEEVALISITYTERKVWRVEREWRSEWWGRKEVKS